MSGEPAMPHRRFFAPASCRMFVRQTSRPVAASRQRSSPLAAEGEDRPSAQAGVARGPSPPPIHWLKRSGHALVHSSRPVMTS